MKSLAVVVHLGRQHALGEHRRVDAWVAILDEAGYLVETIRLLPGRRATLVDAVRSLPLALRLSPRIVPEAMAWSARKVRAELTRSGPAVVVCVSSRAFRPDAQAPDATVVLDYVDRLSDSYRDRSALAPRRTARLLYRLLAWPAARFENSPPPGVVAVAAGHADAEALGAAWVPNVVEASSEAPPAPADVDLLFVGTLSYPPNLDALEYLSELWPELVRRRPGTTLLVAGARPSERVVRLTEEHGWLLVADFTAEQADSLFSRCRLAVAPLRKASGLQNKVLDAAARGIAQVISPAAAAGFGPGFPARVGRTASETIDHIVTLLDDDALRARESAEAKTFVQREFSAATRAPHVLALLRSPRARSSAALAADHAPEGAPNDPQIE